MSRSLRVSHALDVIRGNLGLLGDLPGNFAGHGFNLIAVPDKQNNQPFVLKLASTNEILEFTNIGGAIANRGSLQDDVFLEGISYKQRVFDCATQAGIHFETGQWLRQPAVVAPDPPSPEVYFRQANVPHGTSFLVNSIFTTTVQGGPQIGPVDSTPFTGSSPDINTLGSDPITDSAYLAPYLNDKLPTGCLPAGLGDAATIKNPASILQAQIAGQNIVETVVISVSNSAIVNIPFVQRNADAAQVDAIFWIEKVDDPQAGSEPFIQLQYVQRVILEFPAVVGGPTILWPHLSCATLVKTL